MSVNHQEKEVVQTLHMGGIVCMPSDTVYGLFARALDKNAVEKLYEIKGRDESKPFIVLLAHKDDLNQFAVTDIRGVVMQKILNTYTPGPLTFIVNVPSSDFDYLKRDGKTLAFRIPDDKRLCAILKETGPLVAPSANPQGLQTAVNIEEAKTYFGDKVDLYVDGGNVVGEPSTILDVSRGKPTILRQGKIQINL